MAALVDLKMSRKDMAEEATPAASQNPYPYGVCLNLDTDELAKLGITSDNLPAVGDEFQIEAIGKVTRVSENDTEGGAYDCGVSIQITAMALESDGAEPAPEDEAAEEGAAAESGQVGGKPQTLLSSAYRGRN